jgi:hypothetical protein
MLYEYDVFISHATEDKEECVRPLADELKKQGRRVWYDELSLELGDNLKKNINDGLLKSRYGIIVISTNFLRKIAENSSEQKKDDKEKTQKWIKDELKVLINKEKQGRKVIIPIWHKVGEEDISKYMIGDFGDLLKKLAVSSSEKNYISRLVKATTPLKDKVKVQEQWPKSKIIERQIGEGSLADIFEIRSTTMDRKEAIKILARQDLVENFDQSVRSAVKISD